MRILWIRKLQVTEQTREAGMLCYRQLSQQDRTQWRYQPPSCCYPRCIGTAVGSRFLENHEQGDDPVTNQISVIVDERIPCNSRTPLFYGARRARRTVQITLDRHRRSVIRSLELRDGVGNSSLWSLREQKRGRWIANRRLCFSQRILGTKALCYLRESDPEPEWKANNLRTRASYQGGGRALEQCKSL